MKKIFFLILPLVSLLVSSPVFAHDFEAKNEDGVTIYYKTLNSTEVAVTYQGDDYSSYRNEYSGDVVIPSTVTYSGVSYSVVAITEYAFYGCDALENVGIPEGVTTIGDSAFGMCTGLKGMTLPRSVTYLGYYAFGYCSAMTSLTLGDSVDYIGEKAFYRCASLTSVTIPDSVERIGDSVFAGCSGLEAFYGAFASDDNRCLIVNGKLVAFAPIGLTEYTTPDDVTMIGVEAFYNCEWLISVKMGDPVTYIDEYAFNCCIRMASVTMGKNMDCVQTSAFNYCNSLTAVKVKAKTPPTCYSSPFPYTIYSQATLYVPEESVDAYKTAAIWEKFWNIEGVDFNGVEDVLEDANGEAEYYDLRGVRVENPSRGIYIRRMGDEVSKIVVK